MFSKKITDTDVFMEMPLSSQALYFHLNMHADDDGFISNVKTIVRMVGASNDDFKLLIAKQLILPFESGVVVIKDWRIHNYIQNDRKHKTLYADEKKQLDVDENGMYTKRVQDVSKMDTEVRLGKARLGKASKDNAQLPLPDSIPKAKNKISKPELDQRFKALWTLYPNKKGKDSARKSYEKAVKSGVSDELIKRGIDGYVAEIKAKKTEKQYIRYGSTWFNQRGWEDDYDTSASQKNYYSHEDDDQFNIF